MKQVPRTFETHVNARGGGTLAYANRGWHMHMSTVLHIYVCISKHTCIFGQVGAALVLQRAWTARGRKSGGGDWVAED